MRADRLVCLLLSSSLLLAACGGDAPPAPVDPGPQTKRTPTERLALKTFSAGCGDFLDYAADALTEQFLTNVYCLGIDVCPVFAAMPVPEAQPSPAPPGAGLDNAAGPDRVSGTTLQEQGVDEADIVKADVQGRLYILSGRQLHVIDAFPPVGLEQRSLTSLDLAQGDASFYASDFFFDEAAGLLVALAGSYAQERPRSIAIIVDVSDPAQPQILRRIEVDGVPLQARRIEDRVHRVSRFDMPLPPWFYGDDPTLSGLRDDYFDAQASGDEAAAAQIRAQIRNEIGSRVDETGAAAFLPRDGNGQALACDDIAHPDVTTGLGLAVVDSFNTDGGAHDIAGVINNGYLVYASPQNLYLAQSSFGWFFAPDQLEETVIYRLALSDSGAPAYRGLAKFDGTINSSYQMSEFDGALRVAATVRRSVNDRFTTVSHVSVFDAQADNVMPRIGLVDGLAPDETIQGTRFVGPRGYVVTFRQIDPLFAIDLSEPTAPRVASELKIPGFSSYLMPLGDELLLTIGRAGDDEQLTGGVAIQLFDTSDLEDVSPVAIIAPDVGPNNYSHSIAEYDPHAFSYFPDSENAPVPGTLSVPLQSYGEGPNENFSGFLVVSVDPASASPLAELGRVDHRDFVNPDPFCGGANDTGAPCRDAVYAAEPRRSVFIEDGAGRYLYTISLAGLIASDATQPSVTLGSRELPFEPPCCYYEDLPPPGSP